MSRRPCKVLLYGATGYSGRLIAAEGEHRGTADGGCRMILAARDRNELTKVAAKHGMEWRCFGLDHPEEVVRHLDDLGVDVVLNAAGPFGRTAERLASAAIAARCHYVDINGEVDVYKRLDDLDRTATQQEVALVSGAAATAATSDIMVAAALELIVARGFEVGTIRIAERRVMEVSRGSVLSAARQLREQVVTVRRGIRPEARGPERDDVLWHEPVGRLERMFDFGDGEGGKSRLAIASAANVIDTLVALCTVRRHKLKVRAIESYVETGPVGRIGYQVGGLLAMFSAFPGVRGAANAWLGLLPDGPEEREREARGHVVVVEIEDQYRQRLVEWRLTTPDVYQWTAQLAVAAALAVPDAGATGWATPSEVLRFTVDHLAAADGRKDEALRGSRLQGFTREDLWPASGSRPSS